MNKKTHTLQNSAKVIYTNADSLTNKINELQVIIDSESPEFICIAETLPKNCNTEDYCNINFAGYVGYHSNVGRGISVYVKDYLNSEIIEISVNFKVNIFVKVKLLSKKIVLLGCIYRSPNSTNENNENLLLLLEEVCGLRRDILIIVGDFNYKEVDWVLKTVHTRETHAAYMIFEKINDLFLDQIVEQPTRYRQGEQENTLDWVLTDNYDTIINLSLDSPLGTKGDHCIIKFDVNITIDHQPSVSSLNYFKGDYEKLRAIVNNINWEVKMKDMNTEESWNYFYEIIMKGIESCIPKKKTKKNHLQLWVNEDVKIAKRNKNKLWKNYMSNKTQENWGKFTKARNISNRVIIKAKSEFENKIALEIKNNPKLFWNYIKSKSCKNNDIPSIIDTEGNECPSDTDKANAFNEYFASVYTRESMISIPDMPNKPANISMNNITISEAMVEKQLSNLNISKAPGPDQIHAKVLYELRSVVSKPLHIIYERSLFEGRLPKIWKRAYIRPLFKKGDRKTISNYRPVSLTSICCKTLERLVKAEVTRYLETNNLICDNQHGFRAGKSCATQLLEIMQIWTDLLDRNIALDCIYLDFSKAFDKVPHKRLTLKIESFGIGGNLLKWLSEFLDNRIQQVVIKDTKSGSADVLSGIPQGSVLGPLLFIMFINDLPNSVNSQVKIFADDTKVFKAIESLADNISLQSDLDKLMKWSSEWQLPFNVSKCKIMHYGNNNPEFVYRINDYHLDIVDHEKDLGVTFDNKLRFTKHINNIVAKANSRLGIIRRNFTNLTPTVFLPIYKSLVRPLLEYCSCIWNPALKMDYNDIEKIQRRATKLVSTVSNLSYQQRLKSLRLDSLAFRRRRSDIIQVFKIFKSIDNLRPSDFFELSELTTRGHSLKIKKPRILTKLRQNSFAIRTINDWNSLSESAVSCVTINSFKTAIKNEWANHPERYMEQ